MRAWVWSPFIMWVLRSKLRLSGSEVGLLPLCIRPGQCYLRQNLESMEKCRVPVLEKGRREINNSWWAVLLAELLVLKRVFKIICLSFWFKNTHIRLNHPIASQSSYSKTLNGVSPGVLTPSPCPLHFTIHLRVCLIQGSCPIGCSVAH